MANHEEFAAAVAASFKFLETDYGMRPGLLQSDAGRRWISYGNVNVKVVVEHELPSQCSVTVEDLRFVKRDPLERGEFDLDEVVAVSGSRPPRQPNPRSLSEAVARVAETLKAAGSSVLQGDFEKLHARQRRAVEALRVHHPLDGPLREQ
jgi:hypothetical protein